MTVALNEAEERLQRIDERLSEMGALQLEKSVLERFCLATRDAIQHQDAFITTGRMLPTDRTTLHKISSHDLEDAAKRITPEGDRLWKAIHIVMSFRGMPMTAEEVLEALEREGIPMSGTNRRETVRSAILRKPDLFQRVGRGIFALTEWPDRVKNLRNGEGKDGDFIPVTVGNQTLFVPDIEDPEITVVQM
jgi:hypothetical protein